MVAVKYWKKLTMLTWDHLIGQQQLGFEVQTEAFRLIDMSVKKQYVGSFTCIDQQISINVEAEVTLSECFKTPSKFSMQSQSIAEVK